MSPIEKRVLVEAMRLPQSARAALAGRLLESLDPRVDEGAEAAWADEIARRITSLDEGRVRTTPWATVRRRLLKARRGLERA